MLLFFTSDDPISKEMSDHRMLPNLLFLLFVNAAVWTLSDAFLPRPAAVALCHRTCCCRTDSRHARTSGGVEEEDFDSYSHCLSSPKQERQLVLYGEDNQYAIVDDDNKQRNPLRRAWRKLAVRQGRHQKPGSLILLLSGESTWAANHTFTGWADPSLNEKGYRSSQHAARLLIAEGLQADVVYTSRLTRAIQSARAVMGEWDSLYLPLRKTWRLNGRMYGAVQGLSKETVSQQLGASVVQAWRNSYKARPPPLPRNDPASPAQDRRYGDLERDVIPVSESSKDCIDRARPVWEYRIRPDLEAGNNVLVVAHRDSLYGLIQQVHPEVSAREINNLALPRGVPVVFRFDNKFQLSLVDERDKRRISENTKGVYLGQPGLLEKALEREENWKNHFAEGPVIGGSDRASTVERALWQLREEQRLATTTVEKSQAVHQHPAVSVIDERWTDDPRNMEDFDFFAEDGDAADPRDLEDFEFIAGDEDEGGASSINEDIAKSETVLNIVPASEAAAPHPQDEPVVVLVRHGRTPHNNMGLFTGWEDAPLAPEGEEDAKRAGRLLKRYGFEFDVAYTSQLTRAIQTATYILEELDSSWIPLIKSWRLNERHYGALTGKSKRMIENEYGKEQLVKWRRGYKIRPPPVSSFDMRYPGNDMKRIKHVTDLPISWSQTIARSLEQRRLVVHRRFPKSESLHDCMQRSIPFYSQRIVKETVNKNKRVLIASHENAIRGILMHLCNIPEEAMRQLHLPNGLPLIYNVRGKCITLLEDDLDDDSPKVSARDFGPPAKYLFRPCDLDDSFFEEMEKKGQATATKKNPESAKETTKV